MLTMLMAMAMAQTGPARIVDHPDPQMFSERPGPGALVDPHITHPLCASDDGEAVSAMDRAVTAGARPAATTCTLPMRAPWQVVRVIADRCVASPGAQWCDIEAHAVELRAGGERRYAVVLLSADQTE